MSDYLSVKELKKNFEELKKENIKKDKKIEKLEKKIMINEQTKINHNPSIFYDKNDIEHFAYAYKISQYIDEIKKIILQIQDKSYIVYTFEQLRDNLEKKHPGKTTCNKFTRNRYGISIDGSSSLYMNPMSSKYKDSIDENICYYCYSDNEELNKKFKKNNPVGTHIILNVVKN